MKAEDPTAQPVAERALELLRRLAGPDAGFRQGQLQAIEALVRDRARVLVVQRTGWGKSAVYFIASRLMRDEGARPTLLISPLLALMRNQIQMAERLGVSAETVNSSNEQDWERIAGRFHQDLIDVLVVSPERLGNERFRRDFLPRFASGTGLVVIDEVHCISDWGHDFRPDYRRVKRVLDLLPTGVPVLGTTATANDRVVEDVKEQLGRDLVVHRGPLTRRGLRLQVHRLPAPAQRLAWLVAALERLPGSGIVYCLTIRDSVNVAEWLRRNGISALVYNSEEAGEAREAVESALLRNEVKVVVSTSALGMGFDKPDLAFVVHFQSPGSPIAYYQQVGRAGRALPESFGILLAGNEDREIQDYFIKTAFPEQALSERVVGLLAQQAGPLSLNGIMAEANIAKGRLERMLKVLEVDGVVEKVGSGYQRTLRPWTYPRELVDAVTAARRREQQVMRAYAETSGCLMEYLSRELDDPSAGPCGVCQNCAGTGIPVEIDPALVRSANQFLRRRPIEIQTPRQWPPGQRDRSGNIREDLRLRPGRALSRLGDGGWGSVVWSGKYEAGEFSPELVEASAALVNEWSPQPAPAWVTFVPSLTRDRLVAGFAGALAGALGLPLHPVVRKVASNQPQKEMQNRVQQYRNVAGAFQVDGPVNPGPVLLIDDLFDSGWTFTVVGVALREAGSGPVFPFALAAAVGK